MAVSVRNLRRHHGETVTVRGWLADKEHDGESARLCIRDGSGYVSAMVGRSEVSEEAWQAVLDVTPESTLRLTGIARAEDGAPAEIEATDLAVRHLSAALPVTEPAAEGAEPLAAQRHVALRGRRQRAVLAIRHEVCQAVRDFHYERDFVLVDTPVLTPTAGEDAATLLRIAHPGGDAFLAPSGQLYLEPACAAFGKVYCMGPSFRAEPRDTGRHLTEFWMVEGEVAFLEFEGMIRLAEELVCYLVARVLERCREHLETLGREVSKLEKVVPTFAQTTYTEAVALLRGMGCGVDWGDELGRRDQARLTEHFDRPVFVTRFPAALGAFYMQGDPEDDRLVLGAELLAPEGYGEILGGSQRIDDHDLLKSRLAQHELPLEPFQWYLDVRRYGSFPHSGFGLGVERFVAWMSGVSHVRDAIPYPRTLGEIYP